MRDNKLRAWDKQRKAMFQVMQVTFDAQYDSGFSEVVAYPYDDWNKSADENGEWANRAPRDWSYLHQEIDNLDFMWFTGREDRKGREIYDGDLLEAKEYWGEREYATVVWNDHQLQWYLTRNGALYEPLRTPFANGSFAFEIVGNVHEHPELVKHG